MSSRKRLPKKTKGVRKITRRNGGSALLDAMRCQPGVMERMEKQFPNVEEMERRAPRLWSQLRKEKSQRRAFLEKEIRSRRRAFYGDNPGALIDALLFSSYRDGTLFGMGSYHGDHWVGIPRWAVQALMVLVSDAIPRLPMAQSGPHARWAARWEQDCIDYERWKVVKQLLSEGVRFTDGRVYEEAIPHLRRGCHGGAETIRKSYMKVQRRLKSKPERYMELEYARVLIRSD